MDNPVFAVLALIALGGFGLLCLSFLLMFLMWALAPLRPWWDDRVASTRAKLPKLPSFHYFRTLEGREPVVLHLEVRDKGWPGPLTGPH